MNKISFLKNKAKAVRRLLLTSAFKGKSGHIGSALSTVDIITALYFKVLNVNPKKPKSPDRDIFILSKGHGCLGLYSTLALKGFFSVKHLDKYFTDNSLLAGHPVYGSLPGIEASTGSLGHGLGMGLGMAYTFLGKKQKNHIFVMLSDGECDEGSTWETIMLAGHLKTNNLIAIVDYNKIQSIGRVKDVLDLEPFADKWRAFNWNVLEMDGHNMSEIVKTLNRAKLSKKGRNVIIAHTVKGKGADFMEDTVDWHYLNLTPELLGRALAQQQ